MGKRLAQKNSKTTLTFKSAPIIVVAADITTSSTN